VVVLEKAPAESDLSRKKEGEITMLTGIQFTLTRTFIASGQSGCNEPPEEIELQFVYDKAKTYVALKSNTTGKRLNLGSPGQATAEEILGKSTFNIVDVIGIAYNWNKEQFARELRELLCADLRISGRGEIFPVDRLGAS
jgi:hypothetical protein